MEQIGRRPYRLRSKEKPLADKIAEGNPGKRKLEVVEFKNTADLKGQKCKAKYALRSAKGWENPSSE